MKKVELYNLFVGDSRIPPTRFGPFGIDLKENYEELVCDLYQQEQIEPDWNGRKSIIPERKEKWVSTADLYFYRENEKSILHDSELEDGGEWDICQLLTFITGRSVATENRLDSLNFKKIIGEPVCQPYESLITANCAWEKRDKIKESSVEYALLIYNESLNHQSAQVLGLLNSCCFNILCDRLSNPLRLNDKVCGNIKKGINELLFNFTKYEREKITSMLFPLIDSGFVSLLDKTRDVLIKFGIVSENVPPEVDKRIRQINSIRNMLIHAGKFPNPIRDKSRIHNVYYCISIIVAILQEISRLILGNLLGFSVRGAGSISQNSSSLREFFYNGIWRNSKIDEETYEEWLEKEVDI